MSDTARGEPTSHDSAGAGERGFLVALRAAALVALAAGALGSLGLMLYSGRNAPRFLIVLFAIWVLSPFIALVWASGASKRWSVRSRTALYSVMLIVAVGSLASYAADAMGPPHPQAAFIYVVVAPASWLLMAVVAIGSWISGRRSRRERAV